MIGLKIAAQTRCFAQSIKKALHTAARLECDGVQIDARTELKPSDLSDTGLRQLRKMLDDLNIRIGSVAFPTRRGYANPADLQPRIEATMAAIALASRLNARFLVASLGTIPTEADNVARDTLNDALQVLGAYADRQGVTIAFQTVSEYETIQSLFQALPEHTLAIDLHPANLISRGESPAEFIARLGQYIGHVHATDGVYDLATRQGVETELGRGTADFPELLGMLEEFGYRNWMTIERRNSPYVVDEIGNAVRYLRSL